MKRSGLVLCFLACAGSLAVFAGGKAEATGATPTKGLTRIEYDAASPTGGQTVPWTKEVYSFDMVKPGGENFKPGGVYEQVVKEKLNLDIKISALPSAGYADKLKLMIVSDSLPELIYSQGLDLNTLDKLGMQGMVLALSDYFDIMPNLRKVVEESPEIKPWLVASNGKIYQFPTWGTYTPLGLSPGMWMYREEVLKKLGVEPKFATFNDLRQTALAVKRASPDLYPIHTRNWRGMINVSNFGWGTGGALGGRYYDDVTDTWKIGVLDPNYRGMIEYFAGLYKDGLLHPEFITMNSNQFFSFWTDPPAYKGGAIWAAESPDWQSTFDGKEKTYTGIVVKDIAPPPTSGLVGARAVTQNSRYSAWAFGNSHLVSAKAKDPAILMRLLDYMTTKEGQFFFSWGKENVTFKWYNHPTYGRIPVPQDVDPSTFTTPQEFYDAFVARHQWATGFGEWGLRIFADSYQVSPVYTGGDAKLKAQQLVQPYTIGPAPRVFIDDLSMEVASTKETDLNKFLEENIAKFVIGQRPISEWDVFIADVNKREPKVIVDIYSKAWQKTKQAMGTTK